MNKIPKTNLAQARSKELSAIQPLSAGKKPPVPPPVPARVLRPTEAALAAKGATEAAERDRKLDLILHRFAKLL